MFLSLKRAKRGPNEKGSCEKGSDLKGVRPLHGSFSRGGLTPFRSDPFFCLTPFVLTSQLDQDELAVSLDELIFRCARDSGFIRGENSDVIVASF